MRSRNVSATSSPSSRPFPRASLLPRSTTRPTTCWHGIAHIDTVEQALAFLQQLSDADRQRLAASPTPLAKFADVRSPDEAIARMMALPEMERLQLLAMFQKANAG